MKKEKTQYKYFKRIVNNELVQIWFRKEVENTIWQQWYKVKYDYFGEGVNDREMIEITLEEFKELAAKYNCLGRGDDWSKYEYPNVSTK